MTASKYWDFANFIKLKGKRISRERELYNLCFSKDSLNYSIFYNNDLKNKKLAIHIWDGKKFQEIHNGFLNGLLDYSAIFNELEKKFEWSYENEKKDRYDQLIKNIPKLYLESKNHN